VSLLSREFGKASVSLSGMTPAHLARDGEDGILVFDDVVGTEDRPALDEGDVLFVDGSQGVIGIPGGFDRAARRAIRRMYAPLRAYAAASDDESHLRAVIEEAATASDAAFAFLLEAALLYRVVPPGVAARRLLAAIATGVGRPAYEPQLASMLERILDGAAQRCDQARAALSDVDDLEELQRALRTLESGLERDLRLVEDLGGDPDRLENHLEGVLGAAAERRSALEVLLRDEIGAALKLTDESLRTRLGGLFRLLRRARTAGVTESDVAQLHARLSRQLADERARAGTLLVVPLIQNVRPDRTLLGGKAASLVDILRALPEGCRTPRGFVVTSASYRLHLLGEIGEKLRVAAESHDEAVASRLARAAILSASIPDDVREAIADAFHALGAAKLAVRSSATIEDGPLGSLAGLFDTYLGVQGLDDLMDRVRWIWASLWNARAIAALAATGLSPLRAGQAVLVQELIETTSAGVLLSRDPGGRPDTLLINATWGLGEGISQGDVTGDLYWVRRSSGELVASEPGASATRIELASEGMGTVEVPLGPEWKDRRCLNDSQLSRLAALARALEATTGRAQDVEFGFGPDDGLVVFQLRRIVPRRAE
jgi:hypothetical protein